MEISKIRVWGNLQNLADVAKLFYAEELAPYIPPDRVFRSVRIIADYGNNAVFLKTEAGFTNQALITQRPDLFIKGYSAKGGLLEDITLAVLDKYRAKAEDITISVLKKLESSIFDAARFGQLRYLRRHGGAHIKTSAEISVADLKSVADVIFTTYVCDGRLMMKEMQTTFPHGFHILLDCVYGRIFTSNSVYNDDDVRDLTDQFRTCVLLENKSDSVYNDDDVRDLTDQFKACALLENKSDCTREDLERYILTAARVALWADILKAKYR